MSWIYPLLSTPLVCDERTETKKVMIFLKPYGCVGEELELSLGHLNAPPALLVTKHGFMSPCLGKKEKRSYCSELIHA